MARAYAVQNTENNKRNSQFSNGMNCEKRFRELIFLNFIRFLCVGNIRIQPVQYLLVDEVIQHLYTIIYCTFSVDTMV